MSNPQILWADDEIELLRPHVMFLEKRGYDIHTVTNGNDAIAYAQRHNVDLVFLDENMPGLTGLETLAQLKELFPTLPVVMITKSEEEDIMDQAIGSKIADYLIKPVLPNQMLLSIKKNLHVREITQQTQTSGFQQEFMRLQSQINMAQDFDNWVDVYRRLVYWETQLGSEADPQLGQMLQMLKTEANKAFGKYIKRHYPTWARELTTHQTPLDSDRPLMSPDLFKTDILPRLDAGEKVFLIVIDNFRLDQWRAIQPLLDPWFSAQEEVYCSILPTATQYARNAIFSGLMPIEIARMFPDLWVDEDEEEGKNLNEEPLVQTQLNRFRKNYTFSYHKIFENSFAEHLLGQLKSLDKHPLNIIVMNFIDMLSHARTESKTIRELAGDEAAYRALTRTWLEHSPCLDIFRTISEMGYRIILTTDHGSIRVNNAVRIVGDKNVNPNLRYKVGKNLNSQARQLFWIDRPEEAGLPLLNVSSRYAICSDQDFLAYPNNYNYYVQYYTDTLQHGGISLEEMLIPLITLTPKK